MTARAPHRLRVSIGLRKTVIAELTEGAQTIHDKFVENASILAAPPVAMVDLQAQIADVVDKHQATRVEKLVTGARRASVGVLWSSLGQLCTFTQALMDRSPATGPAIAQASWFHVVQVGERHKDLLTATLTNNKGEVLLDAYADKLETPGKKRRMKRTYHWHGSPDGWKTVTTFDPSPIHRTLVTGLPLDTDWEFEVAVQDAVGVSAWQGLARVHVF